MRYFFNIKDGATILDEEGIEFDNMQGVKDEAVGSSADLLKGLHGEHFWSGEPWLLWVTDQPNGGGNTVLTLRFSPQLSAWAQLEQAGTQSGTFPGLSVLTRAVRVPYVRTRRNGCL